MPFFTPRHLACLALLSAMTSGCSGDVDRLQAVAPIYVPTGNVPPSEVTGSVRPIQAAPAASVELQALPK